MDASAIELDALTRSFRVQGAMVRALDSVDLTIARGEVVALLGENGAGKTTLAKILSTLLSPTSGAARVMGHDVVREPQKVRARTTVVFGGDRGLYGMLDAVDNLRCFGAVHGVDLRTLHARIPEVLDLVGLGDAARRQVRGYSKGMRQRLHLAVGLLTRPDVLLLDEPSVGLDPNEAVRLRDTIRAMHREGTTILLTSHNLDDVEHLANRVLVLRRGTITHDLTLDAFRSLTGKVAVVTAVGTGEAPTAVDALRDARITRSGHGYELELGVSEWRADTLRAMADALEGLGARSLRIRESTLDEAFAAATIPRTDEP